MNRYDERYEIRLAKNNDIVNIMDFINKYWKQGHIMSCDREYFEYEFLEEDNVNFILAIERGTGEIEGLLGFLRSSHSKDKSDIWGSMWKVNNLHHNEALLGIELQRRVDELARCRYHNGIGINPHTALPLMRMFFKKKVGKMNQYYILNESITEYFIAEVHEKVVWQGEVEQPLKLFEISAFSELKERYNINSNEVGQIPYKDEWYVEKKFFCNPRRKYKVFGISRNINDTQIKGFVVTRECHYKGATALRILDFYGKQELFAKIGAAFHEILLLNQYEYVDFYTLGFNEKYIESAGFRKREENCCNIIPNYFEPFERENVDIWVQYDNENTVFFKADGDQDRCNNFEEKI